MKFNNKSSWTSVALVLLLLIILSFAQEGFAQIKVQSDCTDPVCSGPPAVTKAGVVNMGLWACEVVKDADNGRSRLVVAVEDRGVPKDALDIYLRAAYDNNTRLRNILDKSWQKCSDLWISCTKNGNCGSATDPVAAYVMPVLYPKTIWLCNQVPWGFCRDPAEQQKRTILHELTHLGGSTDNVDDDDINAHRLEHILPRLREFWYWSYVVKGRVTKDGRPVKDAWVSYKGVTGGANCDRDRARFTAGPIFSDANGKYVEVVRVRKGEERRRDAVGCEITFSANKTEDSKNYSGTTSYTITLADSFAGLIMSDINIELKEVVGVPTLSQWGLIALGLLLAGSLAWVIRRRFSARPVGA